MNNLKEWLIWIKSLHVTEMDLSLERVSDVFNRLNKPMHYPVITIGGTNGKGSSVAGLEAIYLAQGYRVGAFTTPFLFKHNEQVRIQGNSASDEDFCEAYRQIENVRGDITLTPFEFNALAAFIIFHQSKLDVGLLEVGLGGKWDATNVINADVSVITSIGIDHTEWLGNTREAIAKEKAGIFRSKKPVVCGDDDPPATLIEAATRLQAPFFCQGKQFGFDIQKTDWRWWSEYTQLEKLPFPNLAPQNMSTVLKVVELLQDQLPVTKKAINQGLIKATLPGRLQVIPGKITHLFDVSHNPAAAEWLAKWLQKNPIQGKTQAVFSMLADKDIVTTLLVTKEVIDNWFIAPINEPRGASLDLLNDSFQKADVVVHSHRSLAEAYQAAVKSSKIGDRIIIFGSFRTVAQVMPLL